VQHDAAQIGKRDERRPRRHLVKMLRGEIGTTSPPRPNAN
jgi:hypothetical protein